jgi:hypothetical protein
MLTDSDLAKLDQSHPSRGWGPLKGLSGSTIIAVLGMVTALFAAYYSLLARAALQEAAMIQQKEFLMAQDAVAMAAVVRISSQLDKIEAKVDRVIEARKP